ncbi:hypothetical protein Dsin_020457 [Dipteronia sinensis]|uniref:Uncharacterized protein n=1 Tax=Dipteronia sinensis TaxID=43782 RepID=A0AAE0E406_9ROSI|nr:hypothetical protein Dsin_020457 [Dipteronia sinensis]
MTSLATLSDIVDVSMHKLNLSYRASLQELLIGIVEVEHEEQREGSPCVIYDALMYSVEAVAHSLKLPSIILCTMNAISLLTYFAYPHSATLRGRLYPFTRVAAFACSSSSSSSSLTRKLLESVLDSVLVREFTKDSMAV